MSMPKRIQRKRTKGWRMPEGAICVDRSTRFGNPWTVKDARAAGYAADDAALAAYCVQLFREWIEEDPRSLTRLLDGGDSRLARLKAELPSLRGHDLACGCGDDVPHGRCHADVLLELANIDAPAAVGDAGREAG